MQRHAHGVRQYIPDCQAAGFLPHLANRTEDWCQVNSWQSTSCHRNSIWLQARRSTSMQMMSWS